MADEDPTLSTLLMDRGLPLGNSQDVDLRRALHVKIKNKSSEPIAVNVVNIPTSGQNLINVYSESLGVLSGASPTIVSYTAPGGPVTSFLVTAEGWSSNIANFTVKLNGSTIASDGTWFNGSGLKVFFSFYSVESPLKLTSGDLVEVIANNFRPDTADFKARILVLEVT